jgi:hypothetical protein
MNRNAITLSLGLLLGPALAQGAIAQPAITKAEAHAIGVDAYLYFYPLISTDITRLTSTNIEASKEPLKGADEHVRERGRLSGRRPQARRPDQFRYALFSRMAGPNEGTRDRFFARYQWALLSPTDT